MGPLAHRTHHPAPTRIGGLGEAPHGADCDLVGLSIALLDVTFIWAGDFSQTEVDFM